MVKESAIFNWIINQDYDSARERNAYWRFTRIPEKKEMLEKYDRQANKAYYIKKDVKR